MTGAFRPSQPHRDRCLMAISGVGQVIGPIAVTALATRADDYKSGLAVAGGVLALSLIALITGLLRTASSSAGVGIGSAEL